MHSRFERSAAKSGRSSGLASRTRSASGNFESPEIPELRTNLYTNHITTLALTHTRMQTASPWSVTSAKRKSTTPVVSATRKRSRLSSGDVRPRIKKHIKQETLTQIGWIPSSRNVGFNDEHNDLEFIHGTPEPRAKKRDAKQSTLRKGDSTLTQMDFFGPKMEDSGFDEDDFIIFEDNVPRNDDAEGQVEVERPSPRGGPVQIDGTYDSPRKPRRKRKRYTEPLMEDAASSSDKEYQPTQKRQFPANPRRPQSRKAATTARQNVLSDPEQNLSYFDAALEQEDNSSAKSGIRRSQDHPHNDHIEAASKLPQTPRKLQKIIPSSQSPESLPPSSRKAVRMVDLMASPRRVSPRKPLQSLDTNTPHRPEWEHKPKSSQSTMSPSPKHKICILKMPRKPMQRKATIADSQEDIFSIHGTSSPPEVEFISANVPAVKHRSETVDNGPEIPNTSQLDLDKNLPSSPPDEHGFEYLANLPEFGLLQDVPISQPSESPVLIRDFAGGSDKDITPRPQVVSNDQTQIQERETDFGSPIANDTQFNTAFKIPPPRLVHQQSKIPLNDVRDQLPASSPSQRLPTQTQTQTQRSVRPAAMPRQSQISTQDPTQSMHLPSSIPTSSPHYGTQKDESITIKDSSYVSTSLSQIPLFNEDDEGEVDLDDDHAPRITPNSRSPQLRPLIRPLFHNENTGTKLSNPLSNPSAAGSNVRQGDRLQQVMLPGPYQPFPNLSASKRNQMPDGHFKNRLQGLMSPEPRAAEDNDEEEDTQYPRFETVKTKAKFDFWAV